PMRGAWTYFFHVLHDWPDSTAAEILKTVAEAMVKGVLEAVDPREPLQREGAVVQGDDDGYDHDGGAGIGTEKGGAEVRRDCERRLAGDEDLEAGAGGRERQ
ncbi:hypothetical protein LY78DRAFT_582200, partial [Colletotrichum sublineola]